jgi:uncharacterized protein
VDQRGADAFSLVFDTPPLAEDVEILGFPAVQISGDTGTEALPWFGRLCDVAPDGGVTLVTGGGRSPRPDPLRDPGSALDGAAAGSQPDSSRLALHLTSWVFPRGHRIRLALSNAMWPMIWPAPRPATATVRLGPAGTRLVLPVIPAEPGSVRPAPVFAPLEPTAEPPGTRQWGEMVPIRWNVLRDDTGATSIWWRGATGADFPWGRVTDEEYVRYQVDDACPAGASMHGEARTEVRLDSRLVSTMSVLDVTSDAEMLRYRFRRELREDGVLIRQREWQQTYRRDGH